MLRDSPAPFLGGFAITNAENTDGKQSMVDRVTWQAGSVATFFIQGVTEVRPSFSARRRNRTSTLRACLGRIAVTTAFLIAGASALLAGAGTARADIHDSLVLHLAFDGDATDHTGRGNDGTIVRPGTDSPYVPGLIGMAFQTQGVDTSPEYPTGNYISLGKPADLSFGTSTDFSLSWWGQYTRENQNDDQAWLSNKDWNSGRDQGWVVDSEPNGTFKWNYRERGQQRCDSPHVSTNKGSLDDGQWHHYVVVFARGVGGTGTIYLDGDLIDTTALNSDTTTGDIDFVFPTNIFQDGTGVYSDIKGNSNFAKAAIDDLGIWRRAITADEVTLIYTTGLTGKSALD